MSHRGVHGAAPQRPPPLFCETRGALGTSRAHMRSRVSTFPTISESRSMFFGAACSDCRHTRFVPFERLARDGYGDVPYDQVMRRLKCSKCGGKKLSVTVHGTGVSPLG